MVMDIIIKSISEGLKKSGNQRSYLAESQTGIFDRKRITFMLILLILIIGNGCNNDDSVALKEKIKAEKGKNHSVSQEALNRLQLPEPGIDPNNTVPVIDYTEAKIIEIRVGPVDLPAGTPHKLTPNAVTEIPFDLWMNASDWEMRDGTGNKVSSSFLHHFNIIDPNKRELFYPISRRLFAAGRETPPVDLPDLIGIPLDAGSPLLLVSMFANTTEKDYSDVYLHVWFSYSTEDRFIDPIDVYPFYLDAGGPIQPRDFEVPSGRSFKADTASPVVDGNILGFGGHLHDYGKYLQLVNLTENDTLWKAEPITEGEYHVVSMPTDIYILPWRKRVSSNDRYAVISEYQNPLNKPAPDKGMGALGGVFRPDTDNEQWDKPDYNNEVYRNDLIMTLGMPKIEHAHNITPEKMKEKLNISSTEIK